ncbi:nitrate- and nitrite sensing domain-containing protein [Psychromonas sp. SR45-3]|uniref:nitrate- and nitrite sensing domain-containing protein n=1 Tax=Psychromonas sp. SR45-3 TaxID=2760930 RepID=UPI0015FBF1CE|nr:nitrate- and nitrite sensing domain-containing protein [Psychromonas sp. SR45-3]MBB1273973.1 nitrate- and nitrite sensing domain-containing protein [Psychromonas sp. SR45-3]
MAIYIVILLLMVLVVILLHHYKTKQKKALQVRGLANIAYLKSLIGAVQTHRGLSSAWLNGDQSKQAMLLTFEQQADSDIKYLQQDMAADENGRWDSFVDHWARINQPGNTNDADNNFKQHTQMIANLLYLLEDEAEHKHLNAMSLQALAHIGFVWRELVQTTEMIGQSRAIGTGIATRKICSSVDKIRLSFLQQNMQKTINETLPKLGSLDSESEQHKALLTTAFATMQCLMETIKSDLIQADKITITQDQYFALATNSIKSLDEIFKHQLAQVKQVI